VWVYGRLYGPMSHRVCDIPHVFEYLSRKANPLLDKVES
jgi:hypothetical protein